MPGKSPISSGIDPSFIDLRASFTWFFELMEAGGWGRNIWAFLIEASRCVVLEKGRCDRRRHREDNDGEKGDRGEDRK